MNAHKYCLLLSLNSSNSFHYVPAVVSDDEFQTTLCYLLIAGTGVSASG